MRSTFKTAIFTAALLSFASGAQAGIFDKTPADGSGVYVSGFVGGAFPFDADFEGTQQPAAGVPGAAGANADVGANLDSDVYYGAAVGGRLPFKFLNVFQPRLELEISHFESDVDGGNFNGGNQTFSGQQSQTFYLINSYNDIRWKDNQRVVPYIGGGIGLGVVDSDIQYFPNNGVATAPTFAAQGQDTGFATVSAAGVTLNATEKFDVFVEGRYFKTYGIDAERRFIANGNDGFNADLDDDPDGLTLTVGTRVKF
ncbi:hypothetical protein [Litorimonas sp. WD9-15]|uniref:hypothetical protein n=1 Tax=Litorimonas sp. WD9-15 TaxID=3418716 RepID=UPI003CFC47DD